MERIRKAEKSGSIAGEMARVYIGGGLQGPPEKTPVKNEMEDGR
jgi:hypothetical protein